MQALNSLPTWQHLQIESERLKTCKLTELFAKDTQRVEKFTIEAGPLRLDYSKNFIDTNSHNALIQYANARELSHQRELLFAGAPINLSENRAAWHVALRRPKGACPPEVEETLDRMKSLVQQIHSRAWCGYTGQAITTFVNIGIGGSHLGPQMVIRALNPAHSNYQCHFIANIDKQTVEDVLSIIDPKTTLFIIASKTFTTQETLCNALAMREWLLQQGLKPEDLQKHCIAVTTARDKATEFGVHPDHIFDFWDWVGGRYSLWSAIGISIALTLGFDTFAALLRGAHEMDTHFYETPLCTNMPVMLALMGFFYQQFFNAATHAVIPYCDRLDDFVPYLQQLDMESNGKRVNQHGTPVTYSTGPIIWGGVGTNGQHAFHQLLHQGTHFVSIDFLLPWQSTSQRETPKHDLLVAHCLAQAQALLAGNQHSSSEHHHVPGNKPSNMITLNQLDAHTLGALIALYEHKVFTQGILYGINSFDQWGVELGKQIAKDILSAIHLTTIPEYMDASTQSLLQHFFMLHRAEQNHQH